MATKTKKSAVEKNGVPDRADVLTLAEAAAYLRVSEAVVLDSVGAQGLPGRKVGAEWRFLKSSLQEWLKEPPKKTGNEAILAMAGSWKDDPFIDDILKEIYKQRGRPMIESEE